MSLQVAALLARRHVGTAIGSSVAPRPLQVTAVDKSAPTAMCVLALGGSLAKQWGPRLAAERVLPALCPLLVAPALSSQQFATALKTVRDVVGLVEKGRAGAAGADGGLPSAGGGFPAAPGAAAAGTGANGGLGGAAASAPVPTDWMSATAVGPVANAGSAKPGGAPAAQLQASPTAVAAAATGSSNPLAGLQLQQPGATAVRPHAAPASGSGFGLAGGRVGSGRPMGQPLSAASPAASPSATAQGWGFAAAAPAGAGSVGGGGGGGTGMGMGSSMRPPQPGGGPGAASLTSSSQAASLADPFAGLQLEGGSGGSPGGLAWPAAAAPASTTGGSSSGGTGAAVFDPFSLGSGSTPAGDAAGLQWPAPPPAQQQAQLRPGSSAFPAGESLI